MEKCVKLLIEYLAKNRNPRLLFVLALKWCQLVQAPSASSNVPLNRQQIDRLFDVILKQCIATASTFVQLHRRNAANSKVFGEFFQNVYELYQLCAVHLRKSSLITAYSALLITSYRVCSKANANDNHWLALSASNSTCQNDDVELQMALDYGAKNKIMNNKNSKRTASNNDGPPPANDNPQTNVRLTH